jgi:DNA replication protein DnaC
MLTEPTVEKLQEMKLQAMATAWLEQHNATDLGEMSFDERFGLLVDSEYLARENRRLARLLREAKLRISDACIEDIDYPAARKLDKSLVRKLATCRWIQEHQNVVVTGATGTGKTYVACALAQQACRKGYRVLYRRLTRIFDEIMLARADGTYVRFLARLARTDLLVLDDWGLVPLQERDRQELLEIFEDRYDMRSLVITSQLPAKAWHEYLGDPTLADAILDRVLHNAHRIVLQGHSRRKEDSPS